jgi:hypothetical protein
MKLAAKQAVNCCERVIQDTVSNVATGGINLCTATLCHLELGPNEQVTSHL